MDFLFIEQKVFCHSRHFTFKRHFVLPKFLNRNLKKLELKSFCSRQVEKSAIYLSTNIPPLTKYKALFTCCLILYSNCAASVLAWASIWVGRTWFPGVYIEVMEQGLNHKCPRCHLQTLLQSYLDCVMGWWPDKDVFPTFTQTTTSSLLAEANSS